MSEADESHFESAIRRGRMNREAPPPPDAKYQAMESAHRGVMTFMDEIREASREVIQEYNEAARLGGVRTHAGWRVIPGRFDRPASEYGQDNGVPCLVLTDLACGVDIRGLAFTRLEEEGPGGRGYRLAGTGVLITGSPNTDVLKDLARETVQATRRSLERHLDRQAYR